MIRLHVLVEGQTEETFVHRLLQAHFNRSDIYLYPRQIGKPGHRGGIGEYARAKRDVLATLKQEPATYCTTMFDYYGMPTSWPGREDAQGRPEVIEEAILADISGAMGPGFDPARFVPYVQMHEFESLLFSDPAILANHLSLRDETPIQQICAQFATPEEINDDVQTAPSKRIIGLDRGYQKVTDGTLIAQKIGLQAMRAACPHFNTWIEKLEALAEGR